MKLKLFVTFIISFFSLSLSLLAQNYSNIIYPSGSGKLHYEPYSSEGDIIPDFSHCGYMGGGVAIPDIPVEIVLDPGDFSTDDSPRIQQALDQVGQLPLDENGFRGCVLLKKGKYNIYNTIYIKYSGVVLRGEGDDENGSVLVGTKPDHYNLISVGLDVSYIKDGNTQQKIIDTYVPSGTRIVTVANTAAFKVGDNVIVERPSTAEWINYIGMDRIPASWVSVVGLTDSKIRSLRNQGLLNADETMYDKTIQWIPGSRDLFFRRTVTSVSGNKITLNIPITNALQGKFGGGLIYKYHYVPGNLVERAGVEFLRATCVYDTTVTKRNKYIGNYCSDEYHADRMVSFAACKNVWARNLTTFNLGHGISTGKECTFCTIQDCKSLDPIATILGGYRYAYSISGQMCLVQRCYSRNFRHDLSFGASVPGPNAFVDNWGDMSFSTSEPHQRWSTGGLFDNCSYKGPDTGMSASNRGSSGTGHGWAGAQMIFWNCKSRYVIVMKPPTAQNFAIGNGSQGKSCSGTGEEWYSEKSIQNSINYLNGTSQNNFQYTGSLHVGDGFIEFSDAVVSPKYLYYQQLCDRLGEEAVKNVTTRTQQQKIFPRKRNVH